MAMFGALPGIAAAAPGASQMMQSMMPQKKAGMFGSGGGSWVDAIQAGLAGYLAGRGNPAGMAGLQMLNQKRQQALEESKYQNRRKDDFEDWLKQQAWKQANPDPANPHYFEDNMGNLQAVGADGKPQMIHKDPFQWKLVPNGLGGVVPVNIGALMGGQGGQQPLPQTLSDDDWQTQGGPTPQASGGFRSPY
jgi:hypothetical protein